MKSIKFNKEEMTKFYNVHACGLFNDLTYKVPFDGMIGIVDKNQKSQPHAHHEIEIFTIIRGTGVISNSTTSLTIEAGEIYVAEPFESHWLENTGTEDLVFSSIWWDNADNLQIGFKDFLEKRISKTDKIFITATPPTPNGDLHLGHLSGPFLNSDIIKRFSETNDIKAINISGLDDHQNYVLLKAIQTNTSASEAAEKYGSLIKKTWQLANINYDYIIDPKNEKYNAFIKKFFRELYNKNAFIEKETEVFFDEKGNYIFEAFIKGECPHCHAGSDGLACEQCGMPNDCVDLINPVNKLGGTLIKHKVKRLFLPMKNHRDFLKKYLDNINLSYRMKILKDEFLEKLPDISITHPAVWGIKSDIPTYADQVYYVWAEMAPAFLFASKENNDFALDEPEQWSESSKFIQCFGFDNAYFFMFLFPVLWKLYDSESKLADGFITNEFLCLEGSKFSTSRGHAIWGNDILNRIDADLLRFYLSKVSPREKEEDFKLSEFKEFSIYFWNKKFTHWIDNLHHKLNTYFNGKRPSCGSWSNNHIIYYNKLTKSHANILESYSIDFFNTNDIVSELINIVEHAFTFSIVENAIYKNPSYYNEQRTSINLEMHTLLVFSSLVYPIMPEFSKHIWSKFDVELNQNNVTDMTSVININEAQYHQIDIKYITERTRQIQTL